MNPVIVEVSIVPLGTGSTSLSTFVAEIEKRIHKEKKVKSLLTPMGTILEGDFKTIWRLIEELHEFPFRMGARRVSTRILIDDRRDKSATMGKKVRSVKDKMLRRG